ncbi:MAG: gamma-glutamyltransferase [Gammaproteobacteria bacterium]|nr:gamma-glutamyltransferase [Gammaproteobacteria bacterium]
MQRSFVVVASLFLLAACTPTRVPSAEPSTGAKIATSWKQGAIATAANPHAVAAAIEMLQQGGHAVDATIAAHAVLGLVEPQSSGLGGGAFMLTYQYNTQELSFYDGRETAPAGASVDMFMRDGEAMGFFEAWQSGLSVGVPGVVALYKTAHDAYGRLPWEQLFQPAIRLARDGFEVSPRMAGFLPRVAARGRLDENPATAAYFFPGGKALQAGDLLKNPEYATTLSRIATEGTKAFYTGSIAAAIARAANEAPNGGTLTVEDIAAYQTVKRDVVCGKFRVTKICTTTPPSSGGAQIMIAGIYDHFVTAQSSTSERIAAFVDAQRLAYADRDHYFGDPDAVAVPLDALLHPDYLRHRATERFAPDAKPTHGDPGKLLHGKPVAGLWGADTTEEASGTTHLSIIDNEGNAVSMTATIEAPFGSSRWAAGFLLNNELTDFARSYDPEAPPAANAVGPGLRPRSSMSPTMVFDEQGKVLMVTGSPGGNSIPAYVSKSILGVLDWDMSAQEAVDFPNIIARGETVRVEVGVEPGKSIADDLAQRGYPVQERDGENSGLHVIVVRPDGFDGAADKRREGIVRQTQQDPGSD